MKNRMFKIALHGLSAGILLLAFQNCGSGFDAVNTLDSVQQQSETPVVVDPTPETPHEPVQKIVTATETQPITIHITSADILTSSTLPSGANYDAGTRTLRWLPKVGQAGLSKIEFRNLAGDLVLNLKLQIAAVSSASVTASPTDGVRDGDVGFVFIHGMGDVDRCADAADLAAYWEAAPTVISRGKAPTKVVCYDARAAVENVAAKVAQQILDADCGRFNRCILITHSMGGLVAEFMMTHARAAKSTDALPALFASSDLYKQVKDRTLSVISLASAAGGSKVADALQNGNATSSLLGFVAQIARWIGQNTDSTRSVMTGRATTILAPIWEDPGVPVYMIPAYSTRTAWDWDSWTGGLYGSVGGVPGDVFQGDSSLTALDGLIKPKARFDGLVDFRSSCGIMSANADDGPGYSATLAQQFDYCAKSTKKPNHSVWFMSNINHYWMPTDWSGCTSGGHTCLINDYDPATQSFVANASLTGQSAIAAIRTKLDQRRATASEVVSEIDLTTGNAAGLLGSL